MKALTQYMRLVLVLALGSASLSYASLSDEPAYSLPEGSIFMAAGGVHLQSETQASGQSSLNVTWVDGQIQSGTNENHLQTACYLSLTHPRAFEFQSGEHALWLEKILRAGNYRVAFRVRVLPLQKRIRDVRAYPAGVLDCRAGLGVRWTSDEMTVGNIEHQFGNSILLLRQR